MKAVFLVICCCTGLATASIPTEEEATKSLIKMLEVGTAYVFRIDAASVSKITKIIQDNQPDMKLIQKYEDEIDQEIHKAVTKIIKLIKAELPAADVESISNVLDYVETVTSKRAARRR